MSQTRTLAGVILVAIAGVLAAANSYQLAAQEQPDPYSVEPSVQRFATAAERLPADAELGYISDMPMSDRSGMLSFLTAQYTLAPRFLAPVEQKTPSRAIGNFSRPRDYAGIGARFGYAVESDLGNGVVLYRRVK